MLVLCSWIFSHTISMFSKSNLPIILIKHIIYIYTIYTTIPQASYFLQQNEPIYTPFFQEILCFFSNGRLSMPNGRLSMLNGRLSMPMVDFQCSFEAWSMTSFLPRRLPLGITDSQVVHDVRLLQQDGPVWDCLCQYDVNKLVPQVTKLMTS